MKTNGSSNGSVDLVSVRGRFRALRDGLRAVYREREDAIECITLAALSGSHAPRRATRHSEERPLHAFLSCLPDARKFNALVTKFRTEDEIFGPVKLSALKNDQWERNLDGRLAAVECAFLDEVFKSSDSVLNTLLSAMNERLYKGKPIPLRMLVGASTQTKTTSRGTTLPRRHRRRAHLLFLDAPGDQHGTSQLRAPNLHENRHCRHDRHSSRVSNSCEQAPARERPSRVTKCEQGVSSGKPTRMTVVTAVTVLLEVGLRGLVVTARPPLAPRAERAAHRSKRGATRDPLGDPRDAVGAPRDAGRSREDALRLPSRRLATSKDALGGAARRFLPTPTRSITNRSVGAGSRRTR
jgi:hypothetical protein